MVWRRESWCHSCHARVGSQSHGVAQGAGIRCSTHEESPRRGGGSHCNAMHSCPMGDTESLIQTISHCLVIASSFLHNCFINFAYILILNLIDGLPTVYSAHHWSEMRIATSGMMHPGPNLASIVTATSSSRCRRSGVCVAASTSTIRF